MMENNMKNKQQFWSSVMELPELSLAPTTHRVAVIDKSGSSSSSAESESNYSSSSRKRKFLLNHNLFNKTEETTKSANHASVDLQLKDPLPLDWEQCLDLQSGRMYYLNRRTLRKSWEWPNDHHHQQQHNHKLDLELNISPISSSTYSKKRSNVVSKPFIGDDAKIINSSSYGSSSSSGSNNMVALACLNCHLLVILSKTSPSCPNCKYVHSLPSHQHQHVSKNANVKSLHTLSLLN